MVGKLLGWMDGQPDGHYFVEYILATDNINNWRRGYLSIERMLYPSDIVLTEFAKYKIHLSELALYQFMKGAEDTCKGTHRGMSQRINIFNGILFTVSGGFCDEYGPTAPFGEGAIIAIGEGRDYLFQIKYAWRPESAENRNNNLPWEIDDKTIKKYIDFIKEATLCGGINQSKCKNTYF